MSIAILESAVSCSSCPSQERLSDVMRRGARHHPQGRGSLYNYLEGTTCALGAVISGLVGPTWPTTKPLIDLDDLVWRGTGIDLGSYIDVAQRGKAPCPLRLKDAIIFLNDRWGWSRERIADWLAEQGY